MTELNTLPGNCGNIRTLQGCTLSCVQRLEFADNDKSTRESGVFLVRRRLRPELVGEKLLVLGQ